MKELLFNELKNNRKKDDFTYQVKDMLYKDCVGYIKTMNNVNVTECVYTVPMFMIGYPIYNVEEVTKYIGNKLKREKIKVKFLSEKEIFVKWT